MDGVHHLASPDPPIQCNTPLPVEAAYVSEQADDQTLLRVDSINKQYADQVVLANVAFDVKAGEIVGIIGPNGAGKTTLLEVLAGILPAESSDVHWLGRPLPPSRRREAMFYLPDGVRPYQDQPVTRVLSFFANVYRRSAHPFDGFDLRQTRDIVGVLRGEAAMGRTFVLAIHQLLDAERVCDRFILLADGRVRGAGTLSDLRTRTGIAAGNLEDIFLALT